MNSLVNTHPVRLTAPYFNPQGHSELHRYLDAEFIPRFQQELDAHAFEHDAYRAWQQEDRFSGLDNKLVLRLPMHRSFYLVSCEVVCERLGTPALTPDKIHSAGFVIRRLSASGEYSWMLDNEIATGWEPAPTGLRDPDLKRRMCRDGRLHAAPGAAAYTGEQTHPLHVQLSRDSAGKCHTILYGYLPLGGSYTVARPAAGTRTPPFDPASLLRFKAEAAQQLPWPYGLQAPLNKSWRTEFTRPVNRGLPTLQFFELLKLLVQRYHLGEIGLAANSPLEALAQTLYFHDDSSSAWGLRPDTYSDHSRDLFARLRKFSLWAWLQANFARDDNPLVSWIQAQEQSRDANPAAFSCSSLPPKAGAGALGYSLYMSPGDAQELRQLLDQRVLDHASGKVQELPLPKFRQGVNDLYQVLPFVRVRDEAGGQRIVWAEPQARSQAFRVAAPFDPHASRPSLIQMPSLKDLRRGMARGVSMITPPDTFNLLNALNLRKGVTDEVVPEESGGSQLGIQWLCSFSLPVITLVAMILLMIMVSLLNIVFFWLPWVRICLPFPKIDKE